MGGALLGRSGDDFFKTALAGEDEANPCEFVLFRDALIVLDGD
jgi:hypothetical protein